MQSTATITFCLFLLFQRSKACSYYWGPVCYRCGSNGGGPSPVIRPKPQPSTRPTPDRPQSSRVTQPNPVFPFSTSTSLSPKPPGSTSTPTTTITTPTTQKTTVETTKQTTAIVTKRSTTPTTTARQPTTTEPQPTPCTPQPTTIRPKPTTTTPQTPKNLSATTSTLPKEEWTTREPSTITFQPPNCKTCMNENCIPTYCWPGTTDFSPIPDLHETEGCWKCRIRNCAFYCKTGKGGTTTTTPSSATSTPTLPPFVPLTCEACMNENCIPTFCPTGTKEIGGDKRCDGCRNRNCNFNCFGQ